MIIAIKNDSSLGYQWSRDRRIRLPEEFTIFSLYTHDLQTSIHGAFL